MRRLRMLGMVTDFARINKRMHNKSFTADGQISIVGGLNIGDEYFGAHAGANFADLDVAVIGPVVDEVSDAFDLYWNHRAAVPIASLSTRVIAVPDGAKQASAAAVIHPAVPPPAMTYRIAAVAVIYSPPLPQWRGS